MPDAWETELARTWLSSPRACQAFDEEIAHRVGKHRRIRRATPSEVLPMRIERAAAFLTDIGRTPANGIYCSVILALLGEMLLCAETGGILRGEVITRFAGRDAVREKSANAMCLLRNALCHPVAQNADEGALAIDAFLEHVERGYREEKWPAAIRMHWGALADRHVAVFALRQIDFIGRAQAARWHIERQLR